MFIRRTSEVHSGNQTNLLVQRSSHLKNRFHISHSLSQQEEKQQKMCKNVWPSYLIMLFHPQYLCSYTVTDQNAESWTLSYQWHLHLHWFSYIGTVSHSRPMKHHFRWVILSSHTRSSSKLIKARLTRINQGKTQLNCTQMTNKPVSKGLKTSLLLIHCFVYEENSAASRYCTAGSAASTPSLKTKDKCVCVVRPSGERLLQSTRSSTFSLQNVVQSQVHCFTLTFLKIELKQSISGVLICSE